MSAKNRVIPPRTAHHTMKPFRKLLTYKRPLLPNNMQHPHRKMSLLASPVRRVIPPTTIRNSVDLHPVMETRKNSQWAKPAHHNRFNADDDDDDALSIPIHLFSVDARVIFFLLFLGFPVMLALGQDKQDCDRIERMEELRKAIESVDKEIKLRAALGIQGK